MLLLSFIILSFLGIPLRSVSFICFLGKDNEGPYRYNSPMGAKEFDHFGIKASLRLVYLIILAMRKIYCEKINK